MDHIISEIKRRYLLRNEAQWDELQSKGKEDNPMGFLGNRLKCDQSVTKYLKTGQRLERGEISQRQLHLRVLRFQWVSRLGFLKHRNGKNTVRLGKRITQNLFFFQSGT